MKTYELEYYGETYKVYLVKDTYVDNGALAIEVISIDEEGYEESFATLTVNLETSLVGDKEKAAFVDTNNCPWAIEFIKANKLGKAIGHIAYSGWCSYPEYEFDLEKIS